MVEQTEMTWGQAMVQAMEILMVELTVSKTEFW
jgi:hypothetical protein